MIAAGNLVDLIEQYALLPTKVFKQQEFQINFDIQWRGTGRALCLDLERSERIGAVQCGTERCQPVGRQLPGLRRRCRIQARDQTARKPAGRR